MDFLLQKVAYLRGLADGLELDESSKEGKVLVNIIDTLDAFVEVMEDMIDDQLDLEEYVNFIDEDLADLEEDFYEEDEEFEDDFDFDFEDYDDCCGDTSCCCGEEYYEEDDEE